MSKRRDTTNRMTIIRECAICGQNIVTTADTPWMRQVQVIEDGKRRQITKYYCSTECFQSSYIHKGFYDGKAEERRRERQRNTPPEKRAERWKSYYAKHGDEVRKRRKENYWKNHEEELAANQYQKKKRKLKGDITSNGNQHYQEGLPCV